MLKQISRVVREQLERRLFNKKEKVDPHKRKCSCYCKIPSPVYHQQFSRVFSILRITENGNERNDQNDNETCKTSFNLDCYSWADTLKLTSSFALAYAVTQNLHAHRGKLLGEFGEFYPKKNRCIFKRVLNSCNTWKNAFSKHVLTQLPNVPRVKANDSNEFAALPFYGPQTAEEALQEATDNVKSAHNAAVGELENRLGLRYMTKKRYRKAVIHFSAGAALKNSSAAFNLAQCYELGLGAVQDFRMAAKCYRTASDLGHSTAMYNLAVFYVHGWGGLKPDRNKAQSLMEKAAQLGEPNAKALIENRSKNTIPPMEIDSKENIKKVRQEEINQVVETLLKSTSDGYQLPYSKWDELSSDNSSGTSVSRNSVLFSEMEYTESSTNYYSGLCYENGIGVKQNFNSAIEHYSTAAFNGNSQALFNLAACYETTASLNPSTQGYQIPLLLELYKMAADNGHQYATERLKTLEVHHVLGTLRDYLVGSKSTGSTVRIH